MNADELSNAEKVRGATLGQNAVAAGIAQDKLNLLTGRATSRTEIVRARYVEPDALRQLSIRVIEVAPLPGHEIGDRIDQSDPPSREDRPAR